jgi:hypothetical protein
LVVVGDFVLGALVDDRIGQVLDAQTGLTGRRHRRDRVLLPWVDHILDRRAGVEVVEVHDFSITVGVAAPTGRGHTADAVRDIEVDGHLVEAGNILVVGIYALHRDPELWNHPLVFDSDRFSPQNSDGRDRWQYLPFGAGPRSCIGDHFAMLEATLALATIVQRAEIRSTEADFPMIVVSTVGPSISRLLDITVISEISCCTMSSNKLVLNPSARVAL